MAAKFPSITYSELINHIATTISSLVCNIGNNYNRLPTYHTNRVYQRNRILNENDMKGANNVTAVWNVELDGENQYYDRKIYDHSRDSSQIIIDQLVGYLESNGISDIKTKIKNNSVIEQGSFLGLVHNLVTFISNRIVIHTSQERYDIESTPAAEKKGLPTSDLTPSTGVGITSDGKYTCYDSYIKNDTIKSDTKMPGEVNVVSVPSGGDFKIVEDADIKRIIDSLTRLIKKSYRFSGTYYNFNLLSGVPGSSIPLEVYYFGVDNSEASEIDGNSVFTPGRTWKQGNEVKDYSITTVQQTANYKFSGWEKCSITDNGTPTRGGTYENTEAAVSTTKLTLLKTYLWNNDGNPVDNRWYVACVFKEKNSNNTTFTLSNIDDFTKDPNSNKVSCNMIGKDSVTYTGCKVKKDTNNTNPIQYSISSNNGDFSINSTTGAVTCTQPGTATVSIKQDYTLDIKPYSGSYTIELTRNKLSLTSDLFTFSAPSDKTGGKPASFLATVEGTGSNRIIKYSNNYVNAANPGTWTTTVPTEAGKWYCELECDEGTKYLAGTVFDPNWSYTITSSTTKT